MNTNRRKSRGPITSERRKSRSELPQEAAQLYLEAIAEQSGNIRALALAGDDGLLVAGTRSDVDLHDLAALGAACAKGETNDGRTDPLMDTIVNGEDLYACCIPIGQTKLYLTSLGARIRSIKDASSALSRILSSAFERAPFPLVN